MSRFRTGDVVVLNGHRVAVTEVHDNSETVALLVADTRVGYFPQDWLPDPEPCEPETERPLARETEERISRDEWDTFGTKRGVVMAEPETPALTPGMTAVHRDGRLGVYVKTAGGALLWRPFDDFADPWDYDPADLRPVTLVEKPTLKAAVERLWAAYEAVGRPLDSREAALLAYETLFPEPS